jgi:hypothetical protein
VQKYPSIPAVHVGSAPHHAVEGTTVQPAKQPLLSVLFGGCDKIADVNASHLLCFETWLVTNTEKLVDAAVEIFAGQTGLCLHPTNALV